MQILTRPMTSGGASDGDREHDGVKPPPSALGTMIHLGSVEVSSDQASHQDDFHRSSNHELTTSLQPIIKLYFEVTSLRGSFGHVGFFANPP